VLFQELEHRLAKQDVRLFKKTAVETVVMDNGCVAGLRVNGETLPYTDVIVCTQLPDFIDLINGGPTDYRSRLSTIGFLGNATLVMRLNHRLSDTYWVNITDPQCPFVGVIEQTNLLNESHYGGNHLAYISRYMDVDDPLYSLSDNALFDLYYPWLQKVFPAFRREWIEEVMVWRDPHSQAVVSVGYSDTIPAMRTPVEGLYLSTMAQIFPEDRQMSNGVKFAKQAAMCVLERKRNESGPIDEDRRRSCGV
ncbi:hypothetical protein JXA80_06855, partial [bacterium]|nr:hypothetical protein [candidate division CSSED10-310 bacterium]